jgi:hypothetical protein
MEIPRWLWFSDAPAWHVSHNLTCHPRRRRDGLLGPLTSVATGDRASLPPTAGGDR